MGVIYYICMTFKNFNLHMKSTIFILLLLSLTSISIDVLAKNSLQLSSGKINRIENFKSEFVQTRNVDVWLPDGYSQNKKYAVVYMHDGQMLFDSTKTWNRKEWLVDEVFSSLLKDKRIKDCIVVGIWNTEKDRIAEYMPTKIWKLLPDSQAAIFSEKYCNQKGAIGDNYLKFIVEELKPFIDKKYSTLLDKENTVIMGSSMGGLISLYALCEYPEVFGNAVCMSTSWLSFIDFQLPLATLRYLGHNLPTPGNHRLYMDYGTGESSPGYEASQKFADYIIKSDGWSEEYFQSLVFENAIHDEISWGKRLYIPIEFVLRKDNKK